MEHEQTMHDILIVGGGPAGYAAALYAARAGLDVLVLEQGIAGGQIATSDVVDNYPGIPSISGADLGTRMQDHAVSAGAHAAYATVERLERTADGLFAVVADTGRFTAPAVILACGARPHAAGFEGEEAFRGRGVSYCATCDGMFFRNKKVFVIGGGNSACEEALFLSRLASEVVMVLRRDRFRASRGMVERLMEQGNISIRYQTSIVKVEGERFVRDITFRDNATDDVHLETFDEGSIGIFVFAGHDPVVELARPFVELAADGGVVTDEHMATSTPGLYCVGDMRSTALRQVITAAADGAIGATAAYRYLDEHGHLNR